MPILIDGYNLLCQTMPSRLAGLDERGLCHLLASRGLAQGRTMVVCDGGIKPGGPSVSPVEGVELVYAGKGRSADSIILHIIASDHAPTRLTLVSNDRALIKAARRRRCKVVSADRFIDSLSRRPVHCVAAHDRPVMEKLDENLVRYWAKLFGVNLNQSLDRLLDLPPDLPPELSPEYPPGHHQENPPKSHANRSTGRPSGHGPSPSTGRSSHRKR